MQSLAGELASLVVRILVVEAAYRQDSQPADIVDNPQDIHNAQAAADSLQDILVAADQQMRWLL
jgi:hypothetical protein